MEFIANVRNCTHTVLALPSLQIGLWSVMFLLGGVAGLVAIWDLWEITEELKGSTTLRKTDCV